MLRILVSSTYRDLKPERARVRTVIEQLARDYSVAWVGMEEFGALATSPLEVSRQFAERADLIVLLVGASYGSRPPDGDFSFTREEYEAVRRNRIPCLAYVKQVPESEVQLDAARFRARILRELTCDSFDSLDRLEAGVRRDLQRELRMVQPATGDLVLRSEVPFLASPQAFKDRAEELDALRLALEPDGARMAIAGPAGIGKTTLVQEFVQRSRDVLDPIWLRVDELFGRDAFGRLRVGTPRWSREPLIERLHELVAEHPRALLVFDNAQAAPMEIEWIDSRLGRVRTAYLSWDTDALPAAVRSIDLGRLPQLDAKELVAFFCNDEQRFETQALDDLVALTDGDPLLLGLAGRRLQVTRGLTVAELVDSLRRTEDGLLSLHGPTIDRGDVRIRSLLIDVYHGLELAERDVLTAIATLPSAGVSEDSLRWACERFGNGEVKRLDRAVQLGLVEARHAPDWHGHRYRLRAVVLEFLQTTDAWPRAQHACAEYLQSRAALSDASANVVALALGDQMERAAPHLPHGGDWVEALLLNARPIVRFAVHRILRTLRQPDQVRALVKSLDEVLRVPRTEPIALELIALLETLGTPQVQPLLERLWLKPGIRDPGDSEPMLDRDIRAASGKALARLQQRSFSQWLIDRIDSGLLLQVMSAMDAAAVGAIAEVRSSIESCLSDPKPKIRRAACLALADYSPSPSVADRLWQIAREDSSPSTRAEALSTLGVWQDPRALDPLFTMLNAGDPDTRATAVSVLRFFRDPLIADRLAERARIERDPNTRVNIAFVLADFLDPRAVESATVLMDSGDRRSQHVGIHFAGMLADLTPIDAAAREQMIAQLARFARGEEIEGRLLAKAALAAHEEPAALDGLWRDVAYGASGQTGADVARWFAVFELAGAARLWPSIEPRRLVPLLNDPDPAMRAAAALLAGQITARVLTSDLQSLLDDESASSVGGRETVAQVASEALDRIAGKRAPWTPQKRQSAASRSY